MKKIKKLTLCLSLAFLAVLNSSFFKVSAAMVTVRTTTLVKVKINGVRKTITKEVEFSYDAPEIDSITLGNDDSKIFNIRNMSSGWEGYLKISETQSEIEVATIKVSYNGTNTAQASITGIKDDTPYTVILYDQYNTQCDKMDFSTDIYGN